MQPGENAQKPEAAHFPPVTVSDVVQENLHRSLGYLPKGEAPVEHIHQEYPKWVHGKVVDDAAEEKAQQPKHEPKHEAKHEPKHEAKPEPKHEAKPEPKHDEEEQARQRRILGAVHNAKPVPKV